MLSRPPQKVHHADGVSSPAPARLSTPLHGSHSGWQQQASGRTSTTSQWTSAVIFRLQFVQLEGCSGVSSIFVGHRLSTGDEPISLFPVPFELQAETRSPSDRPASGWGPACRCRNQDAPGSYDSGIFAVARAHSCAFGLGTTCRASREQPAGARLSTGSACG